MSLTYNTQLNTAAIDAYNSPGIADNILLNNGVPYRMPNKPGSYPGINGDELEREIDRGLDNIWNFSNNHFNPNSRGFKRFDEDIPGNNYAPYSRASNAETPFGKEIKK